MPQCLGRRAETNKHDVQVNQGLQGVFRDTLMTYWQHIIQHLENDQHDYKLHQLPLARIKKVMKADPEVKMISAEAPILFAKGCDIFITELTMRAWIHAEENKRRTLQRSDIASALTKSDMFDFLIDIVPREEATSTKQRSAPNAPSGNPAGQSSSSQIPSSQQPGAGGGGQPPGPPHSMGAPEYGMAHQPIPQDREYNQNPGMYAPPVPQDANNAYGQQQQQMYGDLYGYPSMGAQQVHMPGGANRENM